MRALIEEYGYTIIAVFATAVMITVVIFGSIIPIMNQYTAISIPEDTVKNEASKDALEENLERADPTIAVDDTITLKPGESFNFKETIKAKNADGNDISNKITFRCSDENSKKYFDVNTGIFGGNDLAVGEYTVVVSVVDSTAEQYFGKTAQKTITIIVK